MDDLPNYPVSLPGMLAEPSLFAKINDHAQDIVVNSLVQKASSNPSFISVLHRLEGASKLRERHTLQFDNLVSSTSVLTLSGSGVPLLAWVERLIERFQIQTWDVQNGATSALTRVGSEGVADLDIKNQRRLGRAVYSAAEGNAFFAKDLIAALADTGSEWPEEFVLGLALEPFVNENREVRLKMHAMRGSVRVVSKLPPPSKAALVATIAAEIGAGKPIRALTFASLRSDAVALLDEVDSDGLAAIKSAVEAVKV